MRFRMCSMGCSRRWPDQHVVVVVTAAVRVHWYRQELPHNLPILSLMILSFRCLWLWLRQSASLFTLSAILAFPTRPCRISSELWSNRVEVLGELLGRVYVKHALRELGNHALVLVVPHLDHIAVSLLPVDFSQSSSSSEFVFQRLEGCLKV